jgi:hypothetical protein
LNPLSQYPNGQDPHPRQQDYHDQHSHNYKGHIALNDKMTVSKELRRMRKKVVVMYSKITLALV